MTKYLRDDNRRYYVADRYGQAPNRKQRRASAAHKTVPITHVFEHRQHQQGDEIACSCGRRWPVGENHP